MFKISLLRLDDLINSSNSSETKTKSKLSWDYSLGKVVARFEGEGLAGKEGFLIIQFISNDDDDEQDEEEEAPLCIIRFKFLPTKKTFVPT